MNASLIEYYSVSSNGYVKHPNIEILGIDPLVPKASQSVLSVEKDFENQSVIKEEENQYEPLETKHQKTPKVQSSFASHMMEREEVSSVHLTPKCNPQSLTHSCIARPNPQRGILKRSLIELQKKNISSQQDSSCDKHLYLELEKQRQLRRQLEKTYKQLLCEIQKKERCYSVDLGQREENPERKRQFSKRTLNYDKSNEGLISYEELETHKVPISNDTKTVKLNLPQKMKEISTQQPQNDQEQQQSSEEHSQRSLSSSQKHLMTQQSADDEADYFRQQKQFQNRVLGQLQNLNKRIEQIDHFLLQKQRQQERQRLEQAIQQKQKHIRRVEEENERLRQQQTQGNEEQAIQLNIMKKVTPTSLYFFLILIMAIVAMS